MGNNNSMINIILDQIQPQIYYSGDIISGQIQFLGSKCTSKIDDIYLTITGDVGYTTIRTARMQNGQTNQITDRHDIRFFGEKILSGSAISTGQKQANSRINDMTNFEPSHSTYPFSVRLPDILPPTIHPTDYPFVRYELQLFIGENIHRYPLRIYPRVNLLQIKNSQSAIKFDTKRKGITIKGIIQRSGLIPGEQTILSLEIYNPIHLTIKRIDVCLIQRYEIEQCRRRLELIRLSVPQLSNTNKAHIETTCPITIPIGIPPSYNFKSKNVHVNIRYDIKLEVKVKGIFSDFELQVPVIIGTDSAEYSSYTNKTTASATPMDLSTIDMLELEVDEDDTLITS